MTLYFLVKYLHLLGAIVILGTGAGIAFFMLMAHRSGEAAFIARTAAIGRPQPLSDFRQVRRSHVAVCGD